MLVSHDWLTACISRWEFGHKTKILELSNGDIGTVERVERSISIVKCVCGMAEKETVAKKEVKISRAGQRRRTHQFTSKSPRSWQERNTCQLLIHNAPEHRMVEWSNPRDVGCRKMRRQETRNYTHAMQVQNPRTNRLARKSHRM